MTLAPVTLLACAPCRRGDLSGPYNPACAICRVVVCATDPGEPLGPLPALRDRLAAGADATAGSRLLPPSAAQGSAARGATVSPTAVPSGQSNRPGEGSASARLAGAPLLPAQDPTTEGAAATTTVEARGTTDPMPGCREHNPAGVIGRAAGAQLTGQRQDGPSQGPATEQHPASAHGARGSNLPRRCWNCLRPLAECRCE